MEIDIGYGSTTGTLLFTFVHRKYSYYIKNKKAENNMSIIYIQGSNFKLSQFWFYVKTCLNYTNCKIFIPNKKQIPAV